MNDEYITRTVNAYDADPKKYEDATIAMTLDDELKDFMERVPTKESPILDAGCAFGRDTIIFADHGYKVQGIDMSEGLLHRAQKLHPEISFQKMDVRKLDFPDDNFAGIWCNATLLHLNSLDMIKALEEFKRVLIPGGIIFMSLKEGAGEEEIIEKFSSNSARYYNYHTIETVRKAVEAAGLTVAKVYTINEREKWGVDKRNLNWVYCFATK
jgi:ubiquinone/menaquinone biosynthesis C-methylase UbiE